MKKALSTVLCLFLIFLFSVCAFAEEFNGADLFTVDIPEEYEQTGAAMCDYYFVNPEGDNFSVSYSEYSEEETDFIVENMSKKDIEEYNAYLTDGAEKAMAGYCDEFKTEILYCEKEKQENGMTALVTVFKTSATIGEKTQTNYQKMYEFSGITNKYTFTFTTSDEGKKDSFDTVFSTITINEAQARSYKDNILSYAMGAAMIGLILFGIIKFLRPKKRK